MAQAPIRTGSFDPAHETDPLIAGRIVRGAVDGHPRFTGPHAYLVAAIVQQLLATAGDDAAVRRSFPELSAEDIEAARRFWHRYPDEIRYHLEKWS
jgi:uncharacterized protein (DUF433 family)